MTSFLFGLIILLAGVLGIVTTLVFTVFAILKRNSKNWKRSGYSLLISGTVVIALILVHEVILFPPNPKIEQLVLSAHREAPIGAYWLGLYNDSTWEFGHSSSEIEFFGTYEILEDTLNLTTTKGTTFYNGDTTNQFLIQSYDLWEVENSGIKGLKIGLNKL
jgi:energy-coupling factor transporter transmembrane protein EcfT